MDIQGTLERIGLTPAQVAVYLYLIHNGSSKAGKIAKGTSLQRSSVYLALTSLGTRGLVGYAQVDKAKVYQATSPDRILEHIKEQEESVRAILPLLRQQHRAMKKEGQVRMFKGIKGVQAVFKDILRSGKDNQVWGDEGNFGRRMPDFAQRFLYEQQQKGIHISFITRRRDVSHAKGTTYRFVDQQTTSNIAVNIYGTKVAIIIWTDEPEAIIIENAEAALAFGSYFRFMWNHAAH